MKNKIGMLKNRFSQHSEPQNIDFFDNASQNLAPTSASRGLRELVSNNRSRALSNAPILHEKDPN